MAAVSEEEEIIDSAEFNPEVEVNEEIITDLEIEQKIETEEPEVKEDVKEPYQLEEGINYFVCLKGAPDFFYPRMKFKKVGTDTFWEMFDQRTGKYTRGIFEPPVLWKDPVLVEEEKIEELKGKIRKDPKILRDKKEQEEELASLKYEANLTIQRLAEICRDAWDAIKQKRTPNYSGDTEFDYSVDVQIQHFVEHGVYDYSEQIVTLIEGLIKYARYDPGIFGDDNINLKVVLRSYKTIADEVKKSIGNEAINKLHDLITCAEVVISVQPEPDYVDVVEPATLLSSTASEKEEEGSE